PMVGLGLLVIIVGLVGLIKPAWIRLPNRWVALILLVGGFILAGVGGGEEPAQPTTGQPAQADVTETAPSQQEQESEPEEEASAEPEPDREPVAEESDPEPEPPLWTAEEDAYRLWVIRHTAEFSEVLRDLGGLLQDPRMWEQEWVVQVGARIAQMRLLVQEAQEQEAPETFASVHAHYMDAMDDYGYVAEHLPRAIDDLDADLLEELVERMERGAARVSAAAEEVTRLVAERER